MRNLTSLKRAISLSNDNGLYKPIRHQYQAAYPAVEQFMIATSRTGSLLTLYKEMIKTPEGKAWAKKIFDKAKSGYHQTTIQDTEGLLK